MENQKFIVFVEIGQSSEHKKEMFQQIQFSLILEMAIYVLKWALKWKLFLATAHC